MFKDKKVLVIGLGSSGRSALKLLIQAGAKAAGVDSNCALIETHEEVLQLKAQATILQENALNSVDAFDTIVVSPGVPQTNLLYQQALSKGLPIVGEVELAFHFLKQPVLGITGTNGKTTVTLLVTHVLNFAGQPAKALGNIGIPITSYVHSSQSNEQAHEWVVAELSSFQLETMKTPLLDAGAILNITPDHLDRYPDMHAYAAAKIQMKHCLKPKGPLYVEEKCFHDFYELFRHEKAILYGYSKNCGISSDFLHLLVNNKRQCMLPSYLQGKKSHDLENAMAAFALCQHAGVSAEIFMQALSSFQKPAHRIQWVGSSGGVHFYDDSKGTNLDAVIKAVDTMPGQVILIAGGVDKGASYKPWIVHFENKVKAICAIGQAAKKMKEELGNDLAIDIYGNLKEAVQAAVKIAKPGDHILLSPGCSSFDMFRDYAHRGDEFQKIVKELTLDVGRD
jgi:UDP-N-acetylmuramoylalanine--D-glutamate ligase